MAKSKIAKPKEFLNKKIFHDYTVEDIFEVGIELKGSEVKSIRAGRMNFKESFVRIIKNEVFILNMHISPLETTHTTYRPDESRDRRLLLHRKQINKLFEKVTKDGYTIVATKLYFNDKNMVKLNIGIGKGKKLHDKREDLKRKTMQRETQKVLKDWNR
ncbi:MAG: SsrA-binding protein SmpB [Campylobacterota bacterium]|nr:SsrA-binding protein SmpB [Campylobacterota bacterium]